MLEEFKLSDVKKVAILHRSEDVNACLDEGWVLLGVFQYGYGSIEESGHRFVLGNTLTESVDPLKPDYSDYST